VDRIAVHHLDDPCRADPTRSTETRTAIQQIQSATTPFAPILHFTDLPYRRHKLRARFPSWGDTTSPGRTISIIRFAPGERAAKRVACDGFTDDQRKWKSQIVRSWCGL
jgi:hypothetical protein